MRTWRALRCVASLRRHPPLSGGQTIVVPSEIQSQVFDPDDFAWLSPTIQTNSQFEVVSKEESHDDLTNEAESSDSESPPKKRSELVEENRSDGHAPIKTASSILMQSLQKSSSKTTSLSDIDVTLFNFHSTKFAERLLNRNVSSVVIVESSHVFSKTAKKFADKLPNVDAYRADIYTLMGVGRKKTSRFPTKLLFSGMRSKTDPDELKSQLGNVSPWRLKSVSEISDDQRVRRPHLLAVLPTSNIQSTILDSMIQHAILHHSRQDDDTVFRYGETNLMTFLSCGTLSQYMCSTNDRLHFLSHQHRRHSALFNKFFDLKMLNPTGYPSTSFHPQLPSVKKITHEKKLAELDFHKDLQYAVQILPRKTMEINGKEVTTENEKGKDLVAFGCFMTQIGREPNAKAVQNVISSLWPESALSISPHTLSEEKIGQIPMSQLEEIFSLVHEELLTTPTAQSYSNELKIKRAI